MKPAVTTVSGPSVQSTATAISMTWAAIAAQGIFPAGWLFTVAAAESENIAEGLYMVDAKFQIGSSTEITRRSALISLTRSAVS